MKFDSEKNHRRSIRLKGYDYSRNGTYFITICSRNRECIFSELAPGVGAGLAPARIQEPFFQLTEIGKIIENNWRDIPKLYKDVDIVEYIIMPNHIHGILVISTNHRRATARVAPTLSQIIGAFKSKCVIDYLRFIRNNQLNEIGKIWQRNYYERIIRDKEESDKFRKYIRNNPYKWAEDENNPINIEKQIHNKSRSKKGN